MTTTTVLGVDPSLTSTGLCWATSTPGDLPKVHLSKTRPGEKGTIPKLDRLEFQVHAVLEPAVHADLVLVESPSFGSHGSATRDLAGLWWLLIAELRAADVSLAVVPPAVLKKWATGKGNADKWAVGQAIGKRWPAVALDGPDEADALTLASMGLHRAGCLPWTPTAYQIDQIERVEWITNEEAAHVP